MSECAGVDCTHPECADRNQRDPVFKYDGNGEPVRLSEAGLTRAERRAVERRLSGKSAQRRRARSGEAHWRGGR